MELGLKNRRALVMGGGRGVGFGIASALAREGVEVVLAGRSAEALEKAVAAIADEGGIARSSQCDLADKTSLELMIDEVGDIDILLNNCGGPPPGLISAVTDEMWSAQFEMMFLGNCRLARALLPGMRDRRWGRIISVVSSGVIQPIPNLGISNALRLAVVGWSKTLAAEVASDDITVNCIAPGRIHTDRVDQLDKKAAERSGLAIEEVQTRSRATIPAGRYGRVDEFARYAAFLAGDAASYVTGTVHRVDGGMIKSI